MHLTHRERRELIGIVALWILLSVLCTITGPFGTYELMEPFARAGYWAAVVAASILGSVAIARGGPFKLFPSLVVWLIFTVLLALLVFGLTVLTYPPFASWNGFFWLVTRIGLSVIVINGLIYVVRQAIGGTNLGQPRGPVGDVQFLRRLPVEVRGPLVRIEAQDHYLNVVTQRGATLIQMRLGDAMVELSGQGLQVHRSHWVAVDAVARHRRAGGRDILVMADDAEVPVSRSYRSAARQAGLF